jgi:uncharacterized damage-inducible protein DinB
MDPEDLRSLFEYAMESRGRFLAKSRELGWEEFVKNREASWYSPLGVFIHILEVEDSWLHYDILGKPWPYGNRDPSTFNSFDKVEAYDVEIREKTRKLMEGLTPQLLASEVVFQLKEGKVKSSIENILIHTFIDELAHLGELICLMWQSNIKPPWTNWIEWHYQSA